MVCAITRCDARRWEEAVAMDHIEANNDPGPCGADARQLRCGACKRSRGVALPVVLLLISMILAVCAASFELGVASARRSANLEEHLRALRAADAALSLCLRAVDAGVAAPIHAVSGEPARWRQKGAFDGPDGFSPVKTWPGSPRPPQCILESWRMGHRPRASVLLVTARGFGMDDVAEAWLQLAVVRDDGIEKRHWRRITVRPR